MKSGRVHAFSYDDEAVEIRAYFGDGVMISFRTAPHNFAVSRDCLVSYTPGRDFVYLEQPGRLLKLPLVSEPKAVLWK